MAERNIVNVVIVCPACKRDFMVQLDMDNPEMAMLIDMAQSTCKGCGHEFPISGNINLKHATIVTD